MSSDDSAIKRDLNKIDDIFRNIDIRPLANRLYESIKKDKSAKQITKAAASKPDPVKSEEACPIVSAAAAVAKSSQ